MFVTHANNASEEVSRVRAARKIQAAFRATRPTQTKFRASVHTTTCVKFAASGSTTDFNVLKQRYEKSEAGCKCCLKSLTPLRVSLYLLFEEPSSSRAAKLLAIAIFTCIIVSIGIFVLETMPELNSVPDDVWFGSETFFTVVFTLEYILRLSVCDIAGGTVSRFILTPMNLVDIAAVMPFFVSLAAEGATEAIGFIRIVRLVRLFRVFKLARYSSGLKLMMLAMSNSVQALGVLIFFLGIGCVMSSSIIYYVEKFGCPDRNDLRRQPHKFIHGQTMLDWYDFECIEKNAGMTDEGLCCNELGNPLDFPSILSTFWWAIVTMTTVGFGDSAPKTSLGKVFGTVTMLTGILLLALPIALVGAKFQEAYEAHLDRKRKSVIYEKEEQQTLEQGMLGLQNMSTRMRLMKFSDKSLTHLALELAKELQEAGSVQADIQLFEKVEREMQHKALDSFNSLVERLQYFSDKSMEQKRERSLPRDGGGFHDEMRPLELPDDDQVDDSEAQSRLAAESAPGLDAPNPGTDKLGSFCSVPGAVEPAEPG